MAGRPKGSKTNKLWGEALRRAALEFHEGTKTKRIDVAARAVVKKIGEGDMSGVREFGLRIDGNVPQAITGADDGPITVAIVKHADD